MISFCVMRRSGELVCNGSSATAGTPMGVSSSLHCAALHSVEEEEERTENHVMIDSLIDEQRQCQAAAIVML